MGLTKTFIDKIPLTEKGKVAFYWDSDPVGFGVKVSETKKVYIAQARVKGKTRRVRIGTVGGSLTLDKARSKAREKLLDMDKGIDPSEEKKRIKALEITLSQVAESYIKTRALKASTISDITKHLNSCFSDWRDSPASKISREKVRNKFSQMSERSHAQANQAFRILRALLNYARATFRDADDMPVLPENPVSVLSDAKIWNHVKPKARRIPDNKIGVAWNLIQSLRELHSGDNSKSTVDYLAFLLLTGCRKNEATKLTWDRVNLEERYWYLPDPKNKHSVTLPLSETLCKILTERPRINEYVFPGGSREGRIEDARKQFRKLSDAIGTEVSAHDMRRTFKAIASACNIELWRCKLLLNHQDSDVTINSYTETSDLRYLTPEIDTISEYIEEQGRIAAAGNVVSFPARKKAG